MIELSETTRKYYKNRNNIYICYEIFDELKQNIGTCFIYIGKSYILRFGNLGYYIFEEFQNQGYATEVVKILMSILSLYKVNEIRALVNKQNLKSKKVLIKNNFVCKCLSKNDKSYDVYEFHFDDSK